MCAHVGEGECFHLTWNVEVSGQVKAQEWPQVPPMVHEGCRGGHQPLHKQATSRTPSSGPNHHLYVHQAPCLSPIITIPKNLKTILTAVGTVRSPSSGEFAEFEPHKPAT